MIAIAIITPAIIATLFLHVTFGYSKFPYRFLMQCPRRLALCPTLAPYRSLCAEHPAPFRATAIELTASGMEVAAAKKVTLETMVGICSMQDFWLVSLPADAMETYCGLLLLHDG